MKVDEVAALLHVDSLWTWSSWLSIQLIMIRIVREVVRHTNIEFTYLKDQFFEKYQSRIVVVEFSEMDLQMSPSKLHEVFALVAVLCSTIILTVWFKGDALIYAKEFDNLDKSLTSTNYKSTCKNICSYHQTYWRFRSLWNQSHWLKSSQRYLRDERLHLHTFCDDPDSRVTS